MRLEDYLTLLIYGMVGMTVIYACLVLIGMAPVLSTLVPAIAL